MGSLISFYSPEEKEHNIVFKLNSPVWGCYGEFNHTLQKFEWENLHSLETNLNENELGYSDFCFGEEGKELDYKISKASIKVISYNENADLAEAIITGTCQLEDSSSVIPFEIHSFFHTERPEKYAKFWNEKIEEFLSKYSVKDLKHFEEESDYGLRYGNDYFTSFTASSGKIIHCQKIFEDTSECNLYVTIENGNFYEPFM